MIELPFILDDMKMITEVEIKLPGKNSLHKLRLIFDTGCSMTTISDKLFTNLKLPQKDAVPITIIGINSEEKGISVVLDSFMLGGVDLGNVRVSIGKMKPHFQDSIILGMNVLMWYDIAVVNRKKKIFLKERRFKDLDIAYGQKYSVTNPSSFNLATAQEMSD